MKFRLAFGSLIWLSLTQPIAAQQQVRVVGNSNADQVLTKDILQNLLLFSFSRDGCKVIGLVKPKMLTGYVPTNPAYITDEPDVTYERWDVELCTKTEAFLISYWTAEHGGTLFKISYPPPADLPN